MSKPSVFISYSHLDEKWKDKLVKQLGVLEKEGLLAAWNDRLIGGGGKWYAEIQAAMEGAEVALLLISADFLTSGFILGEEVPALLKRQEEKGLRVIPVIVKECPWRQVEWLSPLNARPRDGKALEELPSKRVNGVLSSIAVEVLTHLRSKGGSGPVPSPEFLRLYRQRLASTFSRWDLAHVGVVQTGGVGRPIEATLDDMYLPLRLAEGFDIKKTDLGAPITPEDLLARDRPLVIRGPAGSGKTTWMRWTFRRLLEREDAFPVMLVLRDLARRWQDPAGCHGAARALDTFLETWVADRLGGDYKEGEMQRALAAQSGPRPILLVDGWDETGSLGNELREKLLGLRERHPRILIVVTSRPYGEGRPSHSEGFDLLEIQPLSDDEIKILTDRFFTLCYGEDLAQVDNAAVRFQEALARSPEAQDMARTALLLTMMLLISRTQALPDKRHQLYEACVENLLTAPREREGALLLPAQWRPEDRDERLRVVAALAFRAQAKGYKGGPRGAIVRSWAELSALLPRDWPEWQRKGFLAWLAGPAGLLTDRADGTLTFTHLSFQEYLAAWFLNSNVEGSDRIAEFQKYLDNPDWWETLRLWAALIDRANPTRLDPILAALLDPPEVRACSLAGTLLADGLGKPERFQAWLAQWLDHLGWMTSDEIDTCTQAWSATRQEKRRSELLQSLNDEACHRTWLGWLRYRDFVNIIDHRGKLTRPEDLLGATVIAEIYEKVQPTSSSIAVGRILYGGLSLWPPRLPELGLLELWLGPRRILGHRLQLMACCGAPYAALENLIGSLFPLPQGAPSADDRARYLARCWSRDLAHDLAGDWERYSAGDWDGNFADLSGDLARYLAGDLVCDLAGARDSNFVLYSAHNWANGLAYKGVSCWTNALAADLSRDLARDLARYWAHYWAGDLARDSAGSSVGDLARDLIRDLDAEIPIPWLMDFGWGEAASSGRALSRVALAWSKDLPSQPNVALLSTACRLSLHPQSDPSELERALEEYPPTADPLWPALARHLTRRATDDDRALLTDLAQHPERREPPLSWGLQFIVRGDVLLDDGSVVLLDDLTDKAGLPRLPYLEEMPDELEVDWDAE